MQIKPLSVLKNHLFKLKACPETHTLIVENFKTTLTDGHAIETELIRDIVELREVMNQIVYIYILQS